MCFQILSSAISGKAHYDLSTGSGSAVLLGFAEAEYARGRPDVAGDAAGQS